jgi:hypothetical protein
MLIYTCVMSLMGETRNPPVCLNIIVTSATLTYNTMNKNTVFCSKRNLELLSFTDSVVKQIPIENKKRSKLGLPPLSSINNGQNAIHVDVSSCGMVCALFVFLRVSFVCNTHFSIKLIDLFPQSVGFWVVT